MTFRPKFLIILAHDAVLSAAAFAAALLLRFSGDIPAFVAPNLMYALPFGVISVGVLALFRVYRGIWRYTSTRDLVRLVEAVTVTGLVALTLLALLTRLENFPRIAFIILWFVQLAFLAGPRILWRLIKEKTLVRGSGTATRRVLLIGANDVSDLFLREAERQNPRQYTVVGMLDDDPDKAGRHLHGIPILGPILSLGQVLERLRQKGQTVDMLVLTLREHLSLTGVLDAARRHNLSIRRLPKISDLAEGENVTNLKPVMIEDLLGRPPVQLDMTAVKNMLEGRVLLVTGAGGSIGSELCRQVAAFEPKHLVLVDNSEFALYEIDGEMSRLFPHLPRTACLADVTDAPRLDRLFTEHRPQVVFHAAAYKHVPIVEANPVGGISHNLFGTLAVADACARHKVDKMVVISTDKAVNPTNVMGATKRAAEIYCQNHAGPTRYVTVRFGNVLGSKGSVVPLFYQQIQAGGPVTITDKRMTRYFMTIPEAVQLTLQAGAMGAGGEIFVLDMGQPVKIYDMACEMIRLAGLVPHIDIEVREVGLRPGEKLFEELLLDGENIRPTAQKGILLAAARTLPPEALASAVAQLAAACRAGDATAAVAGLRGLIPEYVPAATSPFSEPEPEKAHG